MRLTVIHYEMRVPLARMIVGNRSDTLSEENVSETIFDSEYYKHEFNSEFTKKVLPVSIVFGLTACLGFIANMFVVYIYGTKYKQCNFKYFLFVLGLIGTVQCSVMLPTQVAEMHYWFIFPTSWLCRVSAYVFGYTVIACYMILLLIAIDRFRKVCHPYEWQIQSNTARKLCYLVSALSLVFAAPPGIVSGDHQYMTEYKGGNITVTVCATDDIFLNRDWAMYFMLMVGGVPITIIIIVTCVLYGLILRQFYGGPEFASINLNQTERSYGAASTNDSPLPSPLPTKDTDSQNETTLTNGFAIAQTDSNGNNKRTVFKKLTCLVKETSSLRSSDGSPRQSPKQIRSSGSGSSKSGTRAKLMRKTFIVLIITVTCILALVLTFCLHTFAEDVNRNILEIPFAQLNAFVIIHRGSFSIICAIFPFVYGIRDQSFRRAFLQIFGRSTQTTTVVSRSQTDGLEMA